ncbi:MAG: ABC transporter ATP-binding protein [Chloroflexota bacterium]
MSDPTTIVISDLHKAYGQVQAVAGISQQIDCGQIFGLLGPNGAGKTTLIRLLIGSTKATSGSISVLGLDPIRQKSALRRLIGYMPQTPTLYEDLTAYENIRFFGQAHPIANLADRVREVIEFVGLSERATDQVYKFSGGMKQRVSLACALVHQPQLLFLDEPTSGIDPKLREAFWAHFHQLTADGVTIILSTHQMDEAMNCDQLGVLYQGAFLAADSPRNLLLGSQTKIIVQKGAVREAYQVANTREELPSVLQQYGLDPAVSQIAVEEDTLESVVLGMIQQHEMNHTREAADERCN